MASYGLDTFRRVGLSDCFRGICQPPDGCYAGVEQGGKARRRFAYRFLRQALFGERTVPGAADAWSPRMAQRQDVWEACRQAVILRRQAAEDQYADEAMAPVPSPDPFGAHWSA